MRAAATTPAAHARVAIGYMEAAAENVMRLECPPGDHHVATCPRCQASKQLAKALTVADRIGGS